MDLLRQSPVRNGLIGLAVVGTAAPLAVNHYQDAMRTDSRHETALSATVPLTNMTDDSVTSAWQALEEGAAAPAELNEREAAIQQNIERYAEYNISREMAEDIYDAARDAGVDPDLGFGLVHLESSFKNSATSHVGAIGLTQLMPKTAEWLQPGVTMKDLRNQDTNLRIGFKYLNQLMEKYDGDRRLALLAYNRGPGTVDRVLKQGGNPDNGYVEGVMKRMGR